MLSSTVCRYEHFTTDWYANWMGRLGNPATVRLDQPMSYRKLWEWAAILEALSSRGLLKPGKKGLGFAVGQEKLPSYMGRLGVEVLATDMAADKVDQIWRDTAQHAETLESLYFSDILDRATFDDLIRFANVDMTDLSGLAGDEFDFLWSSCAFEHLGDLEKGLKFVENSTRLLKPGGVAVHTTEYNVSSNDETVAKGTDCIYRKRDIEDLGRRLSLLGCKLEQVDFDTGSHAFDLLFDKPPFFQSGRVHIKLEIGGFVCTSVLLVIHKA